MRRNRKRKTPIRGNWRGKPPQSAFWYPGRLESETTCDLFNTNRFKVQGSDLDYITSRDYEKYIQQSNKPPRWKQLAYNWLQKRNHANGFYA